MLVVPCDSFDSIKGTWRGLYVCAKVLEDVKAVFKLVMKCVNIVWVRY
jgi:hypothetical protein